ncbi:MAG: molybdopterin-dependent oxidoreductase [Theionarchaea archaeon]|nr:molybdopterin-dependent oxidoreductase [Theionarchaea archaeon]
MKYVGFVVFALLLAGCIAQEPEKQSVSTEITPIEDFFVLDLGVQPEINIEEWRLEVTGLVDSPLSLTYEDILLMPSVTQVNLLYCMPGYEGIGEWTGVPLAFILEKAGYSTETVSVVFYAADEYSSSIPLEKALLEDTILAYEMNGVTLPAEHGYPLKLVVPDKVGYKWVKWVVKIELVDYVYEGYWESRGYSNIGNAPNAKSK